MEAEKPQQKKLPPLPIDKFAPVGQVRVKAVAHEGRQIVVVLKHTETIFEPHKDDFYRDKGSKRNSFVNQNTLQPKDPDLKKLWNKRYFLFSKFDRGIKIDDESWYSITPEPMAKHIANRVHEKCANVDGRATVLDAFCGVGGNLIQFARKCGFCVGSDMDPLKVQYARHNSSLYQCTDQEQVQVAHTDFLKLSNQMKIPHFTFPENSDQAFDAVFLSPPWGGQGYHMLEEYTLDNIYPDFDDIMKKSLEFSNNLILFLPRNTSIDDLINRLLPYHQQLIQQDPDFQKQDELVIEVEKLVYGTHCKAIIVSTGSLVRVSTPELARYFVQQFCGNHSSNEKGQQDDTYLKQILTNVFTKTGYSKLFLKHLTREGTSKISLQKIIKGYQKLYNPTDWNLIKKAHKIASYNSSQSCSGSQKSKMSKSSYRSKKSIVSAEESKKCLRDTLVKNLAGKQARSYKTKSRTSRTSSFSQCSSVDEDNSSENTHMHAGNHVRIPHIARQKQNKLRYFENMQIEELSCGDESDSKADVIGGSKKKKTEDVQMEAQSDDHLGRFDDNGQFKYNVVKEEDVQPQKKHIDLKDLSEQNFLDLTADKKQDTRFYGWLHFHPLFDDEDWSSQDNESNNRRQRTNSDQIQVGNNIFKQDSDDEMEFFQELYGGISKMFENAEDEAV